MEPRKFTKKQVKSIRKDHANGYTMSSLAEYYGVSNTVISNIVHRVTYKEIVCDTKKPKKQTKKVSKKNRVFEDDMVKEIRGLYSTGFYSMQNLADEYGVTDSTIHAIIHKRIYAEVA